MLQCNFKDVRAFSASPGGLSQATNIMYRLVPVGVLVDPLPKSAKHLQDM